MTPHLFISAGEALFGDDWFADVAEALDVRKDTVRQWAVGRNPIPRGIAAELSALLAARATTTAALHATIVRDCGPFEEES